MYRHWLITHRSSAFFKGTCVTRTNKSRQKTALRENTCAYLLTLQQHINELTADGLYCFMLLFWLADRPECWCQHVSKSRGKPVPKQVCVLLRFIRRCRSPVSGLLLDLLCRKPRFPFRIKARLLGLCEFSALWHKMSFYWKKKKAELYAFFKPRDVWVKSSFFFLSCFAFLLFPFTSRTSCCDGVTRLYSNISVWCCRIETKRETSLQREVTGADLSGNKSRRGEVWSFTFHGEAPQREQRAASQQLRSRFGKSH